MRTSNEYRKRAEECYRFAALERPDKYPFIVMLADTRGQASTRYFRCA
jgi:hypothetical protein